MVNAFDEAGAARCRVADDGTVRGPLVPGESYEYYPYEPELVEIDPRTLAAGAAAGAAAGSLVPGPGTALGFLAGAGASILAGPVATAGLRNHIERERADGKEGFRW